MQAVSTAEPGLRAQAPPFVDGPDARPVSNAPPAGLMRRGLDGRASVPARTPAPAGIVHLGRRNFHRAHQALGGMTRCVRMRAAVTPRG
jgi:hypothetical protein